MGIAIWIEIYVIQWSPTNQLKAQMKLRLSPQPVVQLELQSTQDELRLLRKALGRFCLRDMVRVGLTEEEQSVFRKFHSDLFEIDIVVGK